MLDRILARLNRMNRTTIFLGTTGIVLISLVLGGWIAASVLAVVALLVAGMIVRSWNVTTLGGRIARLAVLGLVVTLAIHAIR